MIPCIMAAPYQGALKVSDLCDELHRVTASRAMQVKCKVNAVWQARLANAEPQPSLVLATSWLRVQNYKNNQCETILSPNYFWEILKINRWCIASHKSVLQEYCNQPDSLLLSMRLRYSPLDTAPQQPFSRFPVSSTRFAVLIIINIFILL